MRRTCRICVLRRTLRVHLCMHIHALCAGHVVYMRFAQNMVCGALRRNVVYMRFAQDILCICALRRTTTADSLKSIYIVYSRLAQADVASCRLLLGTHCSHRRSVGSSTPEVLRTERWVSAREIYCTPEGARSPACTLSWDESRKIQASSNVTSR